MDGLAHQNRRTAGVLIAAALGTTLAGCWHARGSPAPAEAAAWNRCPPPPASWAADTVHRLGSQQPVSRHPYAAVWIVDGHYAGTTVRVDSLHAPPLDVAPEELESVMVAPRETARTVYGVCDGVGVVLVATKRGDWRPRHEPK